MVTLTPPPRKISVFTQTFCVGEIKVTRSQTQCVNSRFKRPFSLVKLASLESVGWGLWPVWGLRRHARFDSGSQGGAGLDRR